MPLTLADFVSRWKIISLTERASAQSHFIDLCDLLGQPHPAAADPTGERYTFEKHVARTKKGTGFADVWLRDHFGWEYKAQHKSLEKAYEQLNDYREDLLNPPLLVVCDFNRFEVHTNFGNTAKRVYSFTLDDLGRNQVTATCPLPPLEVLRALFGDTNLLRPEATDAFVTQEAAKLFSRLAERLEMEDRNLGASREHVAHFLMRLLFCLFADSVGLLPDRVFRRLVEIDRFYPRRFLVKLGNLFRAMAFKDDEFFGEHTIRWFNGDLFKDDIVLQLDKADMGILYDVAHKYDWSHIAPAIFGTLFERSLDKKRRSLIGAHYTSEDDILLLIEPVVMRPLIQRWHQTRDSILTLLAPEVILSSANLSISSSRHNSSGAPSQSASSIEVGSHNAPTLLTSNPRVEALLADFFDYLASVRILDPACGSGNFLYVALRRLLDLWKEARDFAIEHHLQVSMKVAAEKMVSPQQLFGIETEFYAHELASIVVWIGFLQWKHENGIQEDREPILQKLSNIQHDDAILRYDPEGKPYEPLWPAAEFIVGNPPFLGGKLLRRELGDTYVDALFALYKNRVKAESDLVVYWFEKARAHLEAGNVNRVGLLATQGIRGGANRAVLECIQQTGTIFWAWADRPWLLQGAAVRVSMIAFQHPHPTPEVILSEAKNLSISPANPNPPGAPSQTATPFEVGSNEPLTLNGEPVPFINPDLTTGSNTASAQRLPENANLCFMGTTKVGPFDIDADTAHKMLAAPLNPNGRPNSDVVRPWVNALDITRRPRDMFIIDFGTDMSEHDAALYQQPFEFVRHHVKPLRLANSRATYAKRWWIHGEARGDLRRAIKPLAKYITTPRVTKHRLFVFLPVHVVPDSAVFAFARQDDYFFGVLHSSTHELWARAKGTQLREVESGFRYTPDTTFLTFPFPYPPGTEPSEADSPIVRAIADAARELVRLRDAWLNPPDISAEDLKSRTLTKLYNERPTWLDNAHRTLDQAVFAAYGWPYPLPTQEILARLLALNHQRAGKA